MIGPLIWMLLPLRTNAPAPLENVTLGRIRPAMSLLFANPAIPANTTAEPLEGASPLVQLAVLLQLKAGLPPPVQLLKVPLTIGAMMVRSTALPPLVVKV